MLIFLPMNFISVEEADVLHLDFFLSNSLKTKLTQWNTPPQTF